MGPESGLTSFHGNVLPGIQREVLAMLGGCAGRAGFYLAGLTYPDDAERETMPVMLVPMDWNEVKASLRSWVKEYAASE